MDERQDGRRRKEGRKNKGREREERNMRKEREAEEGLEHLLLVSWR